MKLFEITSQMRALELLEDSGEIPPEVIHDTLQGLQGDFETKAVAVAKFILSMEATSADIEEASKAMKLRADRLKKRAESIKHYLLLQLQITGQKKIETPEVVIRRQNNPPSVFIADEKTVPEQFWVQPEPPPKRIDKDALKKAIQGGATFDGCFVEQGEHVRISV
jgi:hypothetical protein